MLDELRILYVSQRKNLKVLCLYKLEELVVTNLANICYKFTIFTLIRHCQTLIILDYHNTNAVQTKGVIFSLNPDAWNLFRRSPRNTYISKSPKKVDVS